MQGSQATPLIMCAKGGRDRPEHLGILVSSTTTMSSDEVRRTACQHPDIDARRNIHVPEILILEPYLPMRQALAATLEQATWHVAVVRTAHETLQALEQNTYDVLLLDMDIPSGDSWRVLKTLHATPQTVAVVALLGPESRGLQGVQVSGACVMLPMPVGKQLLIAAVEAALKARSGRS